MNTQTLRLLIERYKENFYNVNNSRNNEIFKWKAAKRFRDVWFSEEAKSMSFSEKFNSAKKEFSVLMDNSYVCPSSGVVKIAELDEDATEHLFTDILFADDGGNISERQNNIDRFLFEFDRLREKYYPGSFKFKQDRHSASCYLAFFAPSENYIYRHSESEAFARNIEFEKDIGSGENFKLEYYYEMCDAVLDELKNHNDLITAHFKLLNDDRDESLHLLVFDLIYCCKTYNLFAGINYTPKKEVLKAFTLAEARAKEEREKQEKINALLSEINELECKAARFEEISLINVQVNQDALGSGVIIEQNVNKIKVRFESCDKVYYINKKYINRPVFEDDKEIVDAFTEYDEICDKIKKLQSQLNRIS
ncbi:MAG: hypothetical protein IKJ91_03175 [Clostridia bacterium]|nr:hypothetical protein [Clostridia bacterium]